MTTRANRLGGTLGQRLFMINAVMFVLLLCVLSAIWLMMGKVIDDAEMVGRNNVVQLQRIADA